MSFYQRVTDALRRRVRCGHRGDRYLIGGEARSLLSEAARRLDPQGADVALLVNLLREAATEWGPKLKRKPEDTYQWAAAELLERAYHDPQETP